MKCVVKRKGHEEKFSERKLYKSCYYACKSAHLSEKKCAKISKDVMSKIKRSVGGKKCVTTSSLHKMAAMQLRRHSKDAAFMYETHRDVS